MPGFSPTVQAIKFGAIASGRPGNFETSIFDLSIFTRLAFLGLPPWVLRGMVTRGSASGSSLVSMRTMGRLRVAPGLGRGVDVFSALTGEGKKKSSRVPLKEGLKGGGELRTVGFDSSSSIFHGEVILPLAIFLCGTRSSFEWVLGAGMPGLGT